MFHPD